MEATCTIIEVNYFWTIMLESGIYGMIAIPVSTFLVLSSIIGLIFNKTRKLFYIWVLQISIRFSLLSCALILAFGAYRFGMFNRDLNPDISFNLAANSIELFIVWCWAMAGGIHLLLLISLVAFITKTIAETKQKYHCQPEAPLYGEQRPSN